MKTFKNTKNELKKAIRDKEFWILLIAFIIIMQLGYAINDYLFCPCK